MRRILLIIVALAGCGSDSGVMSADLSVGDMTFRGEFCGYHCCPADLSKPCSDGSTCRSQAPCGPQYTCVAGQWTFVHLVGLCDMTPPPSD